MAVANFELDGISRSIALTPAERDAALVVTARKAPDNIQAAMSEIEPAGGKAIGSETNLCSTAPFEGLVTKPMQACGRVAVLINGAGTNSAFGDTVDLKSARWTRPSTSTFRHPG